jgi:hypothetical protein
MKKILLLFIVCICFSSCFTTKKYHVAENNAKQTLEQNGITVISEYLNEGELAKRHGRGDDNPYIAREFALTPVYSLVFEVEIKNKSSMTIKYDSRETELYFGEKSTRASVVSDIETNQEDEKYLKGSDRLARVRLAKKTMYNNIVRIRPGESYKRYIVFRNNFRQRGECIFHLPLMYNSGNVAEEFEFTYQLAKKTQQK